MKVHEYAIEGPSRHQVLAYCAIGCAVIAGYAGAWLSGHRSDPMIALIPAPSALALLWLSYSSLWGRFLWRLEVFRRLHKVPVFSAKYRGLSKSNDEMPERECELIIHQTWTNMVISYESPLMKGHSITATAFPDTNRVLALLELKPRNVFDETWLNKHSIAQNTAREFSLPQQLVVEFSFKDGILYKAEYYTSLVTNHLGEFYDLHAQT